MNECPKCAGPMEFVKAGVSVTEQCSVCFGLSPRKAHELHLLKRILDEIHKVSLSWSSAAQPSFAPGAPPRLYYTGK